MRRQRTKLRMGFKSERQLPFFMVWLEYWADGEVVNGKVLFTTLDWGF